MVGNFINKCKQYGIMGCVSFAVLSCGQQASTTNEKQATMNLSMQALASDTINQPGLVVADGKGVLKLTAELGLGQGPTIQYMPEWKAFGWFTAKDSVSWDIETLHAGNYEVELEWSVDDKEAGKPFLLQAPSSHLSGTVGKSGSWETFKSEKIGEISLEAGKQKIIFKPNSNFETGALLDLRHIQLVPIK